MPDGDPLDDPRDAIPGGGTQQRLRVDTLARTQPVAACWLPVLGTISGLAMLFPSHVRQAGGGPGSGSALNRFVCHRCRIQYGREPGSEGRSHSAIDSDRV